MKEKYREVVDLLRDANEEIRKGRKRTYPGIGKQTGMFSLPAQQRGQFSVEFSVYKVLSYCYRLEQSYVNNIFLVPLLTNSTFSYRIKYIGLSVVSYWLFVTLFELCGNRRNVNVSSIM